MRKFTCTIYADTHDEVEEIIGDMTSEFSKQTWNSTRQRRFCSELFVERNDINEKAGVWECTVVGFKDYVQFLREWGSR
jgi:3-phenylpropionate/cinnamic acid dioxygenase small subunit|tara:strand:+ start:301 stop:537 length:237 start_codon:yes stop_codon:yes gene_type:complete